MEDRPGIRFLSETPLLWSAVSSVKKDPQKPTLFGSDECKKGVSVIICLHFARCKVNKIDEINLLIPTIITSTVRF